LRLLPHNLRRLFKQRLPLFFFQPLILGIGGNVSSQTLAVTLIALNKEDSDLKKTGRKEIVSGLLVSIGLGIVAFFITYIFGIFTKYQAPLLLALVVSLSVIVTVVIGFLFGFIVPVILSKLKFDPAVASGPFITTSIDIISLVVYFSLALLIL